MTEVFSQGPCGVLKSQKKVLKSQKGSIPKNQTPSSFPSIFSSGARGSTIWMLTFWGDCDVASDFQSPGMSLLLHQQYIHGLVTGIIPRTNNWRGYSMAGTQLLVFVESRRFHC